MTRAIVVLAGVALAAACTDQLTTPGDCPNFCPSTEFRVVDTLLVTNLGRDTAFRGYVLPDTAVALPVVRLPSVESRALFRTQRTSPTYMLGGDVTPYPIAGVDSLRLELTVLRPDTTPRNLTLSVYRVAKTINATTGFADVNGSFVPDSLARSVNLDDLFGQAMQYDADLLDSVRVNPATGDLLYVDHVRNRLLVRVKLDSAQAPYVAADSAELAFGVAVAADDAPQAILGANEGAVGARLTWYFRVDSAGLTQPARSQRVAAAFDTFVFDPPPTVLAPDLVVGGAPAARSVLRVDLPRAIRDSAQVVRATLLLVPRLAAEGVPADSFLVAAYRVQTDLGAKSPLAVAVAAGDSTTVAMAWVRIGETDTVRVEVTRLLRYWAADTLSATTFMLRQLTPITGLTEGASLAEMRFYSSLSVAFRPSLHLTYVPRIHVGIP